MAGTVDPVGLKRHRRIVWFVIFIALCFAAVLARSGFDGPGAFAFLLVIIGIFYILLLEYRIGQAENEQEALATDDSQPYLKMLAGNVVIAAFVVWISSFNILLAGLFGMIVMCVLLPMALSAAKGAHVLKLQRWTQLSVYALAVVSGLIINYQATEKEQRNFDSIIAAIDKYKASENRYPDTLEQLSPKYLASVPTGRFGRFLYHAEDPDDVNLSHVLRPPVKEIYSFKSKSRKTLD